MGEIVLSSKAIAEKLGELTVENIHLKLNLVRKDEEIEKLRRQYETYKCNTSREIKELRDALPRGFRLESDPVDDDN